jgi:hypothetical protein
MTPEEKKAILNAIAFSIMDAATVTMRQYPPEFSFAAVVSILFLTGEEIGLSPARVAELVREAAEEDASARPDA